MTTKVETNCTNNTPTNSSLLGHVGNICQVDCSNRGICDYSTGVCNCFKGYAGMDCSNTNALSTGNSITFEAGSAYAQAARTGGGATVAWATDDGA